MVPSLLAADGHSSTAAASRLASRLGHLLGGDRLGHAAAAKSGIVLAKLAAVACQPRVLSSAS